MTNNQHQKNSQQTLKRLPIAVLCSILCLPAYANEQTQNINTLQEVKVEASKLINTQENDTILQQRYFIENNQYVDALTQAKQVKRLNVTSSPQLNQQQLITQDASVNLNYAPIGYYENYQIRGIPLDFDSGYYLNNMPISNRQMTSLENKQSIQINKGHDEDALSSIGGGTINYLSKRPENIANLNVGWKSSQNWLTHVDIGQNKQNWGYRTNLAYDRLKPYVKTADGHRYLASLALDIKPTEQLKLQTDLDIQQHKQFSVPGYQLLDGTTLPSDLFKIQPETMLNNASWRKPVKTNAINAQVQASYKINQDWLWQTKVAANQIKTDDYVAFPYSFKTNGNYRLYDYQSPNQNRLGLYQETRLQGNLQTAGINHQLSFGVSNYQFNTKDGSSLFAKRELHNLTQPEQILANYPITEQAGPVFTTLKQQQQNAFIQNRMRYAQTTLDLGLSFTQLKEKNYSDVDGSFLGQTNTHKTLPKISVLQRLNEQFSVYTSYQHTLNLGKNNTTALGNVTFLPAKLSKQTELGLKYMGPSFNYSMAWFAYNRPYEYLNDNWEYVQQGKEIRQGIELNAQAQLLKPLQISLGALFFTKAKQQHTGDASLDAAKAFNVPKLKLNAGIRYAIDNHWLLNISAQHEAKKAVSKKSTNQAFIPSYTSYDLSLDYQTKLNQQPLNLSIGVQNIANKHYWKDGGEAFGEGYLHMGAPRTYFANIKAAF